VVMVMMVVVVVVMMMVMTVVMVMVVEMLMVVMTVMMITVMVMVMMVVMMVVMTVMMIMVVVVIIYMNCYLKPDFFFVLGMKVALILCVFFFFKRFIYLLIICKYTVAVFTYSRRGRQILLQMVASHHVVAGI
jgi:hypothetical protein